jgi:hypothetical protein
MTDTSIPSLPELIEKLNETGKAVLAASGGRLPLEVMRKRAVRRAKRIPDDYLTAFTALAREAHEGGAQSGKPWAIPGPGRGETAARRACALDR